MNRIVECVPNFSEGRNREVIDAIAAVVRAVDGVRLLNIEPDGDYNRSVFTFIGEPQAVVLAAYKATEKAAPLIDMRTHNGGHPRMGATDVVPFIPVSGVTMQDCIECAREYGRRVAAELNIPIYLYERAASRPERHNLADVRKGQYEGLVEKLQDPDWAPDFGPAQFNARSGLTITGARPFLIAYNVSLNTTDVTIANEIALMLRESGRIKRDTQGNKVIGPDGKPERIAGRLKNVKGLGVALPEQGIVQVSMNLTDFTVTPPHVAIEECRKEAERLGVRVTGSEVVGLIPKEALLLAGRYYCERNGDDSSAFEATLLEAGVAGLGLHDLYPFVLKEKVIELMID